MITVPGPEHDTFGGVTVRAIAITGDRQRRARATLGSIMSQLQPAQAEPAPVRCRFDMTADAPSGREFCVFEFPGCDGCPNALRRMKTAGSSEDPLKAAAWQGWLAHAFRPKI